MTADRRLLGMLGALAAIWAGLHLATGGLFLTPRNLSNLAVQSSVVGILACGMVFVVVARHIDLSVGSVLGFTGMTLAVLQAERLPLDAAWSWPASLAAALALGAAIGAAQGWWIAWRGVPAFVVTLAGLLVFRGGAWLLTDGRTVAPLHPRHRWLGGGIEGSLGEPASWALGALAAAGICALRLRRRARRRALGVPVPRLGAELAALALWLAAIAGFVAVMNAHTRPGSDVGRGIPVPVLILLGVGAALSGLARATRFGRHVFALGGNPEAAVRAGIDARRATLAVFALSGLLAGLAGAITTARLDAGTNSMGTLTELSVIAAAVLGGTSLAGGAGSVGAAILGAVVMQSLENGMLLLGVSSALREVAIGALLVLAVWLDGAARRRRA